MTSRAVESSACFERVRRLPRRVWDDAQARAAGERLTAALRTPQGRQTLRPVQAMALYEIAKARGALLPIRVGAGKTLVSFLAPRVVPCSRPLIVLPASLIEKTEAEFRELRRDWVGPPFVRLQSYETLGRVSAAKFLDGYQPDLMFFDEAHRLKNPSAACTRRVGRWVKTCRREGRPLVCVFASGTITYRTIRDFAHLSNWALGDLSPAPSEWIALNEWSAAIDVGIPEHQRLEPGVLLEFGDPVREGYGRRLRETPGVVASQDPPLDVPLTIRTIATPDCPEQEQAFEDLRTKGVTPDGWMCADAVEVYRHARELASGFFYRWAPRPPRPWLEARSEWALACRHILAHNRSGLDSEKAVKDAIRSGAMSDPDGTLLAWTKVEGTFRPRTEAVWVSDATVRQILDWARESPGIVWFYSQALGDRLAEFGLRVYGEGAVDHRGRPIMDARPSQGTICASVLPCSVGQNLQAWNRNLIAEVPRNAKEWEQLIGRTHRDGQAAPVTADVLYGCLEDGRAWTRSVEQADRIESMLQQSQKILHADTEGVEDEQDLARRPGWRWRKTVMGVVPVRPFGGTSTERNAE